MSVFNDLRQFTQPASSPTSIDGKFPYGRIPKKAKGNVIIDPGSYEPRPRRSPTGGARADAAPETSRPPTR